MTYPSPLRFRGDHRTQVDILPVPDAPQLDRVFRQVAHWLLSDPQRACRHEAALPLSALLTEGVALVPEACSFAAAAGDATRIGEQIYIEHSGIQGRRRLVELSAISCRLRNMGCVVPASVESAHAALHAWAHSEEIRKTVPLLEAAADPLLFLEKAAAATWNEFLPGIMVPDALGIYAITPVRLAALARRHNGRPQPRNNDATDDALEPGDWDGADLGEFSAEEIEEMLGAVGRRISQLIGSLPDGNLAIAHRELAAGLIDIARDVESMHLARMAVEGVFGLCTLGTVRSAQPSLSIISRYATEQLAMMASHPAKVLGYTNLDNRERGTLLSKCWQDARIPGDARPALKAYDMYMSARYDLQSATFVDEPEEPPSPSCPAILWPEEFARVARLIPDAARTPELARVTQAVWCVATHRPSRPGHLGHAKRSDVVHLPNGQVSYVVRRRRGGDSVKTAAALGPFEFASAAVAGPLLVQKDLITARHGRAGPLWGADESDSRRLFADAVRLISHLCREMTGDRETSFYALRHSLISHEIESLSMPGRWKRDRMGMDRLLRKSGHRRGATAVRSYFHLPMSVVRAHADRWLDSLLDNTMATRWC